MSRVFQLWAYLCCFSDIVCVLKHFPFLPLTIFGVSSEQLDSREIRACDSGFVLAWELQNGEQTLLEPILSETSWFQCLLLAS
jgi:hypothetical protein